MLPSLGIAVATARKAARCPRVRIAARVERPDGTHGVSDSSLNRFETGKVWPQNPDAVIRAYAEALDIEPLDLWLAALEIARGGNSPKRSSAAARGPRAA